jgi:hypothetical protein
MEPSPNVIWAFIPGAPSTLENTASTLRLLEKLQLL